MALARSLVKRPKLLLLDEPLGALDKKLREQTQFELMNIQEQLGVTFVVVTHDQEEAMTLATRIGVMNQGRSCRSARPPRSTSFPNTRFVADFIGSVNMFEGRIVEDEPDHVRDRIARARLHHLSSTTASARRPMPTCGWRCGRRRSSSTREPPAETADNCVHGRGQGDRLHGRPVDLPGAARSGKIVRVTQPNTCRHAEDRITWDERVS